MNLNKRRVFCGYNKGKLDTLYTETCVYFILLLNLLNNINSIC